MSVSREKASLSRFQQRQYGVYKLTYEDAVPPQFSVRIYSLLNDFREVRQKTPHLKRFFADTIKLAYAPFAVYTMTTVWEGIYPAISLYLLSLILHNFGNGFTNKVSSSGVCWSLAATWFLCVMVNIAAVRMHARSLELLIQRFRAYFIPQLIRASLRVDVLSIQDLYSVFPVDGRFESDFPGEYILRRSSQHLQCTLELTSQVFVLLHAILRKRSPERELMLCFCLVRIFVWRLAPPRGISYSGFVYWSDNLYFKRMKTLFGLAFSTPYRADLVLDGMANIIATEYDKSEKEIRDVDSLDPTPWRTEFRRRWYWDFLSDITLDLPTLMYALIFPIHLSPSFVASIALLQHATKSISLNAVQYAKDTSPVLEICTHTEQLYNAINYQGAMPRGKKLIPCPTATCKAGMRITFKQVSLRYPGRDHDALHNVSFEITPGELVLVVGTNGSGKSTMLKLLARLFNPTEGSILVDSDIPLADYDADQFRGAVAFQSQSPVVYPGSVQDNITLGNPTCDQDVRAAADAGRCAEWIEKLDNEYDAQLKPSFDVHCGWIDGIYGYPSEALKEQLAQHKGHRASMSDGERQRLATARTFMRIRHNTTRLVIIDEATSSLDPIAEHAVLTKLWSEQAGKTMVLVTHRFHHLAKTANRILCMKDGRVVENGTHAELMDMKGDYCALYQAQIG